MSVLIRGARVLTLDDQDQEHARADILIEGSRIARIAADLPGDGHERVIEADGLLAMPGLINAHHHSPGNFLKGVFEGAPLELFMLFEVPPYGDRPPSPRLCYLRAMLGALEMLKLGITAVHDDAFFNPYPTPEAIDGLMQAYADAGIRATVALDQPNVVEHAKFPYLAELLPEELRRRMDEAPRQSTAELLELYDHLIGCWHGAEDGRLGASVSCSAPQRVTDEYLQALSELSRSRDLPFNVHVLETRLQRVLGQEVYDRSLVRLLADRGVLDERMQVIHAIWVDDDDIRLLAESGCTVAHNPISNLKLGSGVMPFRRLRDAGVPICLGNDEAAGDDTANLWGVMKTGALVHKLDGRDHERWPRAAELLEAATRGGARAMRRETGVLAEGAEADLILIDLSTLAFTPLNDLRRQLVFCENGSSVVTTMVAGRVVAERGRVLTVDEAAIRAEIAEVMVEERRLMQDAAEAARMLEPYYRAMLDRAANVDVGLSRRLLE